MEWAAIAMGFNGLLWGAALASFWYMLKKINKIELHLASRDGYNGGHK